VDVSVQDEAVPFVAKWAYRHYHLTVECFDSLNEAVEAAGVAADYGEEALECIELWDEGGYRRIERGEVFRHYEAMEKPEDPEPPPAAARIYITYDGLSAFYRAYEDAAEARKDAKGLRRYLGDRVRVDEADE
jgi:hypothetical protein